MTTGERRADARRASHEPGIRASRAGPDRQVEVHGRGVMPWAPTRILTDQDVGDLRQGETIRTAEILPPEWALPAGFPDAEPPIRGFHQDRFVFLLQRQEARLGILSALPGGV